MKRKQLLDEIKRQAGETKENLTVRVDSNELNTFRDICEKAECSMGSVIERLIKAFNADEMGK